MLSALLSNLAPQPQGKANPLDSLSIICLSSGTAATQDQAPDTPADHPHDACCILCMVPGLAAAGDEIGVAAPNYPSSRSFPPTPRIALGPLGAAELLPIKPRAPPHLT
ncbi:hypothetical protein [Bradyrhizobium sediminis]|uniref:hypothetical protein n=1 Tax=Bradyrhizobium sediminis TaxID=2840469 RepID=UPI00352C0D6A